MCTPLPPNSHDIQDQVTSFSSPFTYCPFPSKSLPFTTWQVLHSSVHRPSPPTAFPCLPSSDGRSAVGIPPFHRCPVPLGTKSIIFHCTGHTLASGDWRRRVPSKGSLPLGAYLGPLTCRLMRRSPNSRSLWKVS